jgi:hypothetical protein
MQDISSVLKLKAAGSSETLICICQTIQCYFTEDDNFKGNKFPRLVPDLLVTLHNSAV